METMCPNCGNFGALHFDYFEIAVLQGGKCMKVWLAHILQVLHVLSPKEQMIHLGDEMEVSNPWLAPKSMWGWLKTGPKQGPD